MKSTKLIVKTKTKTYPIYFGDNILNKTGWLIKKKLPGVKKICVISDNKLPKLLLKKLNKSLSGSFFILLDSSLAIIMPNNTASPCFNLFEKFFAPSKPCAKV